MRAKQVKFDGKGDLAYQDSNGRSGPLPIGSDGQVLSVLDATTGIIGWAPPLATSGTVFTCPASLAVGDVVFISGSSAVDAASSEAGAGQTADAVGVVSSKPSSTTAVVNFSGVVAGYIGLTPGTLYYLDPSSPGKLTSTAPSASGEKVHRIGVATSATELLVSFDAAVVIQ